jgi:hypothetical protein
LARPSTPGELTNTLVVIRDTDSYTADFYMVDRDINTVMPLSESDQSCSLKVTTLAPPA